MQIVLGCKPDSLQWAYPKNVIRQLVSRSSLLLIYDVEIDGDDFWLHREAAAVIVCRLIVRSGCDKIIIVPLKLIETRPTAHRRYLAGLQSRKGPPAPFS